MPFQVPEHMFCLRPNRCLAPLGQRRPHSPAAAANASRASSSPANPPADLDSPTASALPGMLGIPPNLRLRAVQQFTGPRHVMLVGRSRHGPCAPPPSGLSTPRWAFIPKYHCFPFFVWCISGSRARSLFFVEEGAARILASTITAQPQALPLQVENRSPRTAPPPDHAPASDLNLSSGTLPR